MTRVNPTFVECHIDSWNKRITSSFFELSYKMSHVVTFISSVSTRASLWMKDFTNGFKSLQRHYLRCPSTRFRSLHGNIFVYTNLNIIGVEVCCISSIVNRIQRNSQKNPKKPHPFFRSYIHEVLIIHNSFIRIVGHNLALDIIVGIMT